MTLRLRTRTNEAAELRRALRTVIVSAQCGRSCSGVRLYVADGDPDILCYVEEWLTAEDLAREVRSQRFGRLLELMETAAEPPELLFRFITETRGLDYVAEVRGVPHPSPDPAIEPTADPAGEDVSEPGAGTRR